MEDQEPDVNALIQACRKEELGAVKEIVEGTGIDVNAIAKYKYGGLLGDFPLLAAAENCNLQLIKYLIGKGANVNACTGRNQGKYNGMTPLQAAVSSRRDIDSSQRRVAVELLVSNGADISALNAEGTPLWELCEEDQPDVTRRLIELGMNVCVKQKSPDFNSRSGITMLHHWAASVHPAATSIIELILAKGADLKALNKHGISPLNVAAVGLPSHEASNTSYHSPNDSVLRFLLERGEYSLSEKIDTLELAGAKLLLHNKDESSISQALQYWNEALDLRESAIGSIPKVPLKTNNIVHWRTIEWTTRDQLRELQTNPSVDKIKIQAIVVAQRIFSRISSEALFSYLYDIASDNCKALLSANRISELLEVCWVMLEGARLHDTREMLLWLMVESFTEMIVTALTKLQIDRNPILSSETLILSLELITDTDESYLPNDHENESVTLVRCGSHDGIMSVIYNLVNMISKLPELITPELKCSLNRYARQNGRNRIWNNVLLMACNRKPLLSILPLVRLLLDAGADPNAVNDEGNSPLHFIAYWVEDETESLLADLLLEFGADHDQANLEKETPLGVWKRKHAGPGDGPFLPPTWTMGTVPSFSVLLEPGNYSRQWDYITIPSILKKLRIPLALLL